MFRAGLLCLALSLAVKPHDSGLVWLFFLLAGGTFRKRALQTLLVFAVLCLPAVLWVTHVSPHWMQEAHSNMLTFSGVAGLTDPAATGMAGRYLDSFVQLQSAVAILWANPRVYNSITYVICGVMLLIWAIVTVRLRPIQARSWLALAAITPLSMLPIYHLQHDAKLLILTIPACAMLWSEGGIIGLIGRHRHRRGHCSQWRHLHHNSHRVNPSFPRASAEFAERDTYGSPYPSRPALFAVDGRLLLVGVCTAPPLLPRVHLEPRDLKASTP